MTRALVTGASGFVGPFLISNLLASGREVVATVHDSGNASPDGHESMDLDVTNPDDVRRVIRDIRPDEVYHLAGLTRPASGAVEAFHSVNYGGTLNVLEAVKTEVPDAAVLIVGSAYAYGRVDHPVTEDTPLDPVNHYGVSKAAADMLGRAYALEGIRVVLARPFNHSGPGQSPDFLLPTLVGQIAHIKLGRRGPIVKLGNLDSVRDISDVRDIVESYRLMLEKGRSGEAYNAGSGAGISVEQTLDLVCDVAGVEVEVEIEPRRVRPGDISMLVANIEKSRRELGWNPRIRLEDTVSEMLNAELQRARR